MTLRPLSSLKPALSIRARVLQGIRSFFTDRGFLEVETPVRIPAPALELHIDAEPSGAHYLRTSPEFHMKRLLAAGYDRVFQVGPCFRQGERGRLHRPEFTLLEWYRAQADYTDILLDAKTLLTHLTSLLTGRASLSYGGAVIDIAPVWDCLTVEEAFLLNAGWNPVTHFDPDRFDLDLVQKVEPALPKQRPVILKDYPAQAAAFARLKPDCPAVAERWELYIGGMEIANAFSELTDPDEQRKRLESCAEQRRAQSKDAYPIDREFLSALEGGLPPSGGIALGVDRLVMLFADADSIDAVRAF